MTKKQKPDYKFSPQRLRVIFFIATTLIHAGLIYLGYSIAVRHIADAQLTFVMDHTSSFIPAEGNIFLFWMMFFTCLTCMLFTLVIWFFAQRKNPLLIKHSFHGFLMANFVPIIAIIFIAFVTFDQLVTILLYLLFFVLFIFFRDK